MSPKNSGLILLFAGATGLLCACKEEKRVAQYTVPKENPGASANDFTTGNTAPAATPTGASGATMNATPALVAQTSGIISPDWTAPAGWVAMPESPMRKGAWKTGADATAAEVSVTAFPGDVGGMQANVTRWCGQIGLAAPASQESLDKLISPTSVDGFPASRVTLVNGDKAMVVVIVMHDGASWFFKISGTSSAVKTATSEFDLFLASVKFPPAK